MHACMYVCMYVCMHACMYVCIYLSMYSCIYVCMYVCMYVCVYIYICIHIYIYIYNNIIYSTTIQYNIISEPTSDVIIPRRGFLIVIVVVTLTVAVDASGNNDSIMMVSNSFHLQQRASVSRSSCGQTGPASRSFELHSDIYCVQNSVRRGGVRAVLRMSSVPF